MYVRVKKQGEFVTTYRSFRYFCKKSNQYNLSRIHADW